MAKRRTTEAQRNAIVRYGHRGPFRVGSFGEILDGDGLEVETPGLGQKDFGLSAYFAACANALWEHDIDAVRDRKFENPTSNMTAKGKSIVMSGNHNANSVK
jgi:hypothetical protein